MTEEGRPKPKPVVPLQLAPGVAVEADEAQLMRLEELFAHPKWKDFDELMVYVLEGMVRYVMTEPDEEADRRRGIYQFVNTVRALPLSVKAQLKVIAEMEE